ncbi:MAG: GAF domain-containing protein [Opitutaceae bacterium]
MAGRTGNAHDQTRASLSEKRNVVSTLYHISTLVGRLQDPAEAMPRILRELATLFECDCAILALVNPDTGALEIEHTLGLAEELNKTAIPSGVGLLGWCALQRRPLVVADAAIEPRHLPLRRNTRAVMAVPLEIDDQLHGVIALECDKPGAYTENHLQTLVLLAGEAASVLSRLWLIESLTGKAGQFEVLSAIAHELAAKLEPAELMETVTRESNRLTGCRLAMLQLFDPATRMVRLQAIHPPGEHCRDHAKEWLIDDSLAGSAITTRKQVEHSHIQEPEYHDLQDIPVSEHLVAVLSTPMVAENEVVGVLHVFTNQVHRFSNNEKRLLRALSNMAAVSLRNARLYQRVFESEESLRQSERLTTLGLLAAEIAHETRNPLTVIRLLFGALNLEFSDDDPRKTDVAIIREKLDQLESFVTRVLTFGKAPESMHSRWPLDDLIRETCLLLRLKLNQARITMHYDPPERPIVVDCNKGQIQQVLLNVILNATHAMPDGGSIRIESRLQRGAARDSVCIQISDTGHGIPPELRERIFESFLSGRPGGTGLGLAIAKRIMRSHHGDIEVASSGPEGTTLRISLPAAR